MRKKLLYITQTFPLPATSGGTIKSLNTIRALSQHFQVHVCSVSDRKPTSSQKQELLRIGATSTTIYSDFIAKPIQEHLISLFGFWLKGIPHYFFQFFSPRASITISRLIKRFDPEIIHIDHLNMAQYLPQEKNQFWILEHHNIESDLLWSRFVYTTKIKRKLYLMVEALLTKVWEFYYLPKFDHIFTISETDKERLLSSQALKSVSTQKVVYKTPPRMVPQNTRKKDMVLFVGGLNWPPNEDAVGWYVNKVWPLVLQQVPTAEFHVIGHDHPYFRQQLGTRKNVFFHGHLDTISRYLNQAKVFVLPFRMGGGVRLKALTALSHGIPLISTKLGVKGLKLKDKKNFLQANTPNQLADKTKLLLKKAKVRERLAAAGVNYVREYHGLANNKDFMQMYLKIIESRSPSGKR